jgi:hypothetical protein
MSDVELKRFAPNGDISLKGRHYGALTIHSHTASPFPWTDALDTVLTPHVQLDRADHTQIKAQISTLTGRLITSNQISHQLIKLRKRAGLHGKEREKARLVRARTQLHSAVPELAQTGDRKYDDDDNYIECDDDVHIARDDPEESEEESLFLDPEVRALLDQLEKMEVDSDDGDEEVKATRKRNRTATSKQLAENWRALQPSLPTLLAARFGKEQDQQCDSPNCEQEATHKCFRGCPTEKHLCTSCTTGPHKLWCADHLVRRWNAERCEYEQVEPSVVFVAAPK